MGRPRWVEAEYRSISQDSLSSSESAATWLASEKAAAITWSGCLGEPNDMAANSWLECPLVSESPDLLP